MNAFTRHIAIQARNPNKSSIMLPAVFSETLPIYVHCHYLINHLSWGLLPQPLFKFCLFVYYQSDPTENGSVCNNKSTLLKYKSDKLVPLLTFLILLGQNHNTLMWPINPQYFACCLTFLPSSLLLPPCIYLDLLSWTISFLFPPATWSLNMLFPLSRMYFLISLLS